MFRVKTNLIADIVALLFFVLFQISVVIIEKIEEVIHRERSPQGSCSCVKWTKHLQSGETMLLVGYNSGNVTSFLLRDKVLHEVTYIFLGSPVSLFYSYVAQLLFDIKILLKTLYPFSLKNRFHALIFTRPQPS